MQIVSLALSPDGSVVAFHVWDALTNDHRVGLFDWRARTVRWVHGPEGRDIGYPRYAPEGAFVAALSRPKGFKVWTNAAIIDAGTLAVTPGTTDPEQGVSFIPKGEIAVQPGTGRLLMPVKQNWAWNLRLYEKGTTRNEVFLQDSERFVVEISSVYFIGASEIIFTATPAHRSETAALLDALGVPDALNVTFQAERNRPPTIKWPKQAKRPTIERNGGIAIVTDISSVSSSSGGRIIIGLADAAAHHPDASWAASPLLTTAVVQILDDESQVELSPPLAHSGCSRISWDGKVIAYLNDPARTYRYDLKVIAARNESPVGTGLLGILNA